MVVKKQLPLVFSALIFSLAIPALGYIYLGTLYAFVFLPGYLTYRQQVELLQAAAKRQPKLKVLTLDYWDPNDAAGIAEIYRVQTANGFSPYVATVELDRLVPGPKAK